MSFRHILIAVVATMFVSTILAAEHEKEVEARLFELLEKMVVKKEQEERSLIKRNLVRKYAEMLKSLDYRDLGAYDDRDYGVIVEMNDEAGQKYSYVIYALKKDVVVYEAVKLGAKDASYESFVEDLTIDNECRYGYYLGEFIDGEGRKVTRGLFVLWLPDGASLPEKMKYDSGIKVELVGDIKGGANLIIKTGDIDELAWDTIQETIF